MCFLRHVYFVSLHPEGGLKSDDDTARYDLAVVSLHPEGGLKSDDDTARYDLAVVSLHPEGVD